MTIQIQNCTIIDNNRDACLINASAQGTGAVKLPEGNTAQRPTPTAGQIRFNCDSGRVEGFDGAEWREAAWAPPTENQLWAWGSNCFGRLGDGTTTARCSPVQEFGSAVDWTQVSAGSAHTAAVKTSGTLWAWGFNASGQLGDGTTTTRCSPVQEFGSATDWARVSAGGYHTAAVKTSGTLWAWGSNGLGQLGDGTTTTRCSPIQEFGSATDWAQVSAGRYHTAAVKTSGTLWAWGCNAFGRLGDGTVTNRCSPIQEFGSSSDWTQVSADLNHTAATKTSGTLWAWGANTCGQLGDGTRTDRCSPVQEFGSATDWTQVSAGGTHTAAVKTSGTLWAWGYNDSGRLGDGTVTNRCSPIQEFSSATDWALVSACGGHTAATKTSGTLWAWGVNGCGRLGDGTITNRCSPVQEFFSATDWAQVSAGNAHTAAVRVVAGSNYPFQCQPT
jgi:alpha-tubulin suppressor-like RCC1 family protein